MDRNRDRIRDIDSLNRAISITEIRSRFFFNPRRIASEVISHEPVS